MEDWSDIPLSNFRIKIFLDTNLLAYLVDETYPKLTEAIKFFRDLPFVDLASSEFVIYEFFGIRKREHYLREVIQERGAKDISSLLKYRDSYRVPGLSYNSIMAKVKATIEGEIGKIVNDFGIIYSEHTFHENLLKPTIDICLASEISKEDSLVLVSAVYPNENYANGKADHTMLLSNDESFCNSFNNTEVNANFDNHSLEKPLVQYIRSIQNSSNGSLNLVEDNVQNVKKELTQKILDIIQEKNKRYYLGETFTPTKSSQLPNNVICFKLRPDKQITNDKLYVTIVSKSLNFIYSTKHSVDFWHNGASISSEFQSSEGDSNISFKVKIEETDESQRDTTILAQLKLPNNLIFIHPDSETKY